MYFKKTFLHKFKPILLLVLFLLIGTSAFFLWPIYSDSTDTLEVMALDTETEPVFKLSSLLPYRHHIINDLVANTNFSLLTSLHFSLTPYDIENASNELIEDLQILSERNTPIFLSVLQDSKVDDLTYIKSFQDFSTLLNEKGLTNVQLVYYPNPNNLKAYQKLDARYAGFTVNTKDDLQVIDTLCHKLDAQTTLFINDNTASHYIDDTKTGAETINYTYYNLAVNYPQIDTIYNPYLTMVRHKWLKDIDANLLPQLDSRYITTYEHIIAKPWVTTKDDAITSTSPYNTLSEYDTLSGQVELITLPDADVFSHFENASDYLSYRFNSTDYPVQSYYPYELTLDTNELPNGINRLKGLIYSDSSTVIYRSSIDLVIDNDNVGERAKRLEANYPVGNTPIYTGDYIPILMYHTIADVVAEEDQNSCVETKVFDSQMKALVDNNYTPITFYDLSNYLNGTAGLPEKPILITMDDGYLNNYTLAYPIYKKYNISATLFVSPFYMKQENTERHFGFNAAREMEKSGLIDIESHGYDHTPFTKLSAKDLKYHISISHGILEQQLGARDVFTVACPQFRNNLLTRKILTSQGVEFQITNLAKSGTGLKKSSLKRINVPNTMTPDMLISTIKSFTS